MKTVLALSALLATSAFAKPVAQITTAGGFTPVPRSSTLTVQDNGSVSLETTTFAGKKVVSKVNVAKLNPTIVAKLVGDVAEANNTTLVAENPEAPECMDAPSTTFSVIKDGALVTIGQKVNCKSYILDDYQGQTALSILENLLQLSQNAQ